METLIEHQTDVLDACIRDPVGGDDGHYEILLHTFNPAAYNPFWFGRPKEGRAAVQRIKDLFARKLPEGDLYRMVIYEWSRRLGEVIRQAPLAGLARGWQELSGEDIQAIEKADRPLKEEFLDELAKADLDPLWVMEPTTLLWQHGVKLLADLIGRHVNQLAQRLELCERLAETFLANLWFYAAAAADGELANPSPVLRELRIEASAHGWPELSGGERQSLEEADGRIKQRFLSRLKVGEGELFSFLNRTGPRRQRAVEELSAAVGAEVPSLDMRPQTRERLAEIYLETLRLAMQARAQVELARVRGLLVRGAVPSLRPLQHEEAAVPAME